MKKQNVKVSVCILAAMLLLVLVSAGCGQGASTDTGGSQTTATTAKTETTAAAAEQFANHLDLTWIVYNQFDNPIKEGTETQKIIEDRFNVTLKIPELDVHSEEQWTVFWASGNMADHIVSNNMAKYYTKFADQGILRPITKEMLYKNAPDYMKIVEELISPEVFIPQITYKGEFWGMPCTNMAQARVSFVMAARKTWMDRVGIAKAPETLDEFYDMCVKFTKNDPDGNGKDDTYGLHSRFSYVQGTFGVYPNSFYDIDGKVVYSDTTNEYKEFLKLMSKWYAEGLIDPEFVTDTRDIQRAKWAEGKLGMLEDHPWWFASSTPNNVSAMLQDKFPGEELVYFPAVKGANGKSAAYGYYPGVTNNAIYFGADTSDEKVERIMAIHNAIASDWDLYVRLYYGEEGKTYTLDADGIIVPNADILTKEKISELGIMQTFGISPLGRDHFNKTTLKSDLPPYDTAFQQNILYGGIVFPTSNVNQKYNEKSEDIKSLSDEFYFNAITGRVNIDAQWDNFIKSLNSAGLQDVLAGFEAVISR